MARDCTPFFEFCGNAVVKKIYLIRHGEVPCEFQHRYLGATDPGLSPEGRRSCEALAEEFRALQAERIYVSPLRRAQESALAIAPERAAEFRLEPALREINFGKWDNLTFDEIAASAAPELLQIWAETPEKMHFPEGESFADFAGRVDDFWDRLLAEETVHSAALVTHGGVIMRILSRWHGLPVCRQHEVLPPRGSLTVVDLERVCNEDL